MIPQIARLFGNEISSIASLRFQKLNTQYEAPIVQDYYNIINSIEWIILVVRTVSRIAS